MCKEVDVVVHIEKGSEHDERIGFSVLYSFALTKKRYAMDTMPWETFLELLIHIAYCLHLTWSSADIRLLRRSR